MFAYVYKILTPAEWAEFDSSNLFTGAPIDQKDGYIHLSTPEQTAETLQLHFSLHKEVIVLEFSAHDLNDHLKYEPSRGGQLFPHYFGHLKKDWVKQVWTVGQNEAGEFMLPDLNYEALT